MKYRPDALSLFYFKDRHEAQSVFNALVAIDEAINQAKTLKDARTNLRAIQRTQSKQVKEFIRRILPLPEDRLKRTTQIAIRRVFTSTHHYQMGLIHRTTKARAKEQA